MNKMDVLLGKEKVLASRILFHSRKIEKARKQATSLYAFLVRIEAGKKSSVKNRALMHDNRYTNILVKLASVL